jgi:hypothetical protein
MWMSSLIFIAPKSRIANREIYSLIKCSHPYGKSLNLQLGFDYHENAFIASSRFHRIELKKVKNSITRSFLYDEIWLERRRPS